MNKVKHNEDLTWLCWMPKALCWFLEFVRTELVEMSENAKYVYAIGFDKSKTLSIKSGRQAELCVTYMFKIINFHKEPM